MLGDSVDLPCPIPLVGPCSEVNWKVSDSFPGFYTEVVRAGLVTADEPPTVRLGAGCSLHIDRLEQDSARTYVCSNGRFNASLSLEILSSKHLDRLNHSHRDLKLNSNLTLHLPFSCHVCSYFGEER